MSNITAIKPGNTALDYSASQVALVRNSVAKDLTPVEFDVFMHMSRGFGLDPLKRQIYAIPYGKGDRRKVSYITGIDGFRSIANRSGNYRPDEKAPVYEIDEALKSDTNPAGLIAANVTIYRFQHGEWFPITGQARWEEFAPLKQKWVNNQRTSEMELSGKWGEMPALMLAKCAEAQALRKGWPEDLSSLYAPEEMEQQDILDLTATEEVENHEQELRQKQIKGGLSFIFEMTEGVQPIPAGQVYDKCVEFIRSFDSAPALQGWIDLNKHPLQEFWAKDKNAALDLRDVFNERLKALKEADNDPA